MIFLEADTAILKAIEQIRTPMLTEVMIFVTGYGVLGLAAAIGTYLFLKRKYRLLALMLVAAIIGLETAYLIKKVAQIPRPYDLIPTLNPASYSTGFSFPSLHSTFAISVIPFLRSISKSKWFTIPTTIFLISVAVSRVYLGVHFLSDMLIGAGIGLASALTILYLEHHHQVYEKLIYHMKTKREVRRQLTHLATGVLLVFVIKFQLLNAWHLGFVLIAGLAVSFISRTKKIPIVHNILEYLERPKEMKRFPGKGSFFLVLGAFAALLLFDEPIALAAITIMAVGDSITALIGIYFGRFRNPMNKAKHLEGTVAAIIVSTLAAFTFVPFEKAFLASAGSMVLEALTIRVIDKQIDDNLLIPIIAGYIMTVVL